MANPTMTLAGAWGVLIEFQELGAWYDSRGMSRVGDVTTVKKAVRAFGWALAELEKANR